jgi:hypothetical protein
MKSKTLVWIHLFLVCLMLGCGEAPKSVDLSAEVVTAGCGMCQYQVFGTSGCYWSVEWEGKPYVVQGTIPEEHENHAPDGMCNMKRQAKVSGRLKSGQFYATSFELLPASGVPETPSFTPEVVH